jgi:hypothetical protein
MPTLCLSGVVFTFNYIKVFLNFAKVIQKTKSTNIVLTVLTLINPLM